MLRRHVLLGSAAALATPSLLRAQGAWPQRPITIVVPFPPGGSNDLLARPLAQRLSIALSGAAVVVENRGGAGGVVGATSVARAPKDGHTLLWGHIGTLAVNPWLYPQITYDPVRDFAPVALVATLPSVLSIHPSLPARTAAEFIALAKAQPGSIEYGSAGNGSASHITMAAFADAAGINLVHVPYRGNGPMLADLLAGRLKAAFAGAPVVMPAARDGKLTALGLSSAAPSASLPGLVPVAEGGPAGFELVQWHGLVAPAGTPPELVATMNTAINAVVAGPELKERFATEGADPAPRTPEAFGTLIATEMERFRGLVRRANITAD
ncbi:Bug family tripartite tricarboxylate transporter substrate binding protein [Muricoccus radiodurans]|uniref:Bug family tripartite tricarboxylate transporter substrate binding protein n=1 Tax=Muricoccus radiodurans TaxID=2231721 RepID=UPI003CEF6D44